MTTNREKPRSQAGFTLIEILVAVSISAMLLGLAAIALRQFWLVNALHGSRDEVVSQLRQLQERSVSESHPLAYGARFRVGTSDYDLIVYNANLSTTAADDTCALDQAMELRTGVEVSAMDFTAAPGVTSVCASQIPGAGASDEFALFFARGTATQGSITFTHPSLSGRSVGLTVTPITGRVEATE